MSEPDDDRDLDAFLARRSPIAEAWREATAGTAAPAQADAAILAAARAAVAARPGSRLRRWRLPIGLAASLVVGIGVLREVERDPHLQRAATVGMPPVAARPAPVEARVEALPEAEPVAADAGPPPARAALSMSAPASPADDPARTRALDRARRADAAQAARKQQAASEETAARQGAADEAAVVASTSAPAPIAPAAAAAAPPPPEAEAAERASLAPSSPKAAAAVAAERLPALAGAVAAATAGKRALAAPAADGRYRDFAFGVAGRDEVIARLGPPLATHEDGEGGAMRLDYGRNIDPRGRLTLHLRAHDGRLDRAELALDPPLPLAEVRGDAALASAAGCRDGRPEPVEGAGGRTLDWPSRGVVLGLGADGQVATITYRAACPPPPP